MNIKHINQFSSNCVLLRGVFCSHLVVLIPGASENGVFGGAEYTKHASRLHQTIENRKKQFLRVFGGAAAEYTYVYLMARLKLPKLNLSCRS